MSGLAILAGSGALPVRLAGCRPDALCIAFAGVPSEVASAQTHTFEKMGALFGALKAHGVTEVVMAGAMSRPPLDPAAFDPVMQALAPRLMVAMQGGDDALLRVVIEIFEEQGFTVRGAHEIDPELTAQSGVLAGAPLTQRQRSDAQRAQAILAALSERDVGQGAVVEGGLCLGIETLQGTDAMLDFVARTPPHLRSAGGVLVKAPKADQDLRVDMPTIGPATLKAADKAGLSAIVVAAQRVIVLEPSATAALAGALNISLIAQDF